MPERLKSPRLRLFVALELPDEIREQLIAWRERTLGQVAEARLPAGASLHVTLVFLGYQYERDVTRIADLCFREPAGGFELRPAGVVGVPRGRPRLYALALEDARGAVAAWQGELAGRLQAAGLYEPEKRPFWSHVTLARGRRNRSLPRLDEPPALPPELTRPFVPDRVTLYQSTLRPQGAVYDPLAGMRLGREAAESD